MYRDFLLGSYIVYLLIGIGLIAVSIDICFWLWEQYRWRFVCAAGVAMFIGELMVFSINPLVDTRHMASYLVWLVGCFLLIVPSASNAEWEEKSKKKLI